MLHVKYEKGSNSESENLRKRKDFKLSFKRHRSWRRERKVKKDFYLKVT